MVTIGDVARAAGVSRSTVSYVLSGKRSISTQTRQRVFEAVDALGFTANAGARALATRRTMVLGLLTRFEPDEFAPAMLQYVMAVTETARSCGYDILLVTDEDGPGALRRIARTAMVDGVVLLDVLHDDPRLSQLRLLRQPGATVGLPADPAGIDVYDLDFEGAAELAVDHLCDRGHREILLITPPDQVFRRGGAYAWRFRDSARRRARARGVRLAVRHGQADPALIPGAVNAALDRAPAASALIVHNDATAAILPSVLAARAASRAQGLAVIGLYSASFARTFALPYTFVESSPGPLGRSAVEALVRRIENPQAAGEPEVVLLPAVLVDRGTTG